MKRRFILSVLLLAVLMALPLCVFGADKVITSVNLPVPPVPSPGDSIYNYVDEILGEGSNYELNLENYSNDQFYVPVAANGTNPALYISTGFGDPDEISSGTGKAYMLLTTGVIEADKDYYVVITIKAMDGYVFPSTEEGQKNGIVSFGSGKAFKYMSDGSKSARVLYKFHTAKSPEAFVAATDVSLKFDTINAQTETYLYYNITPENAAHKHVVTELIDDGGTGADFQLRNIHSITANKTGKVTLRMTVPDGLGPGKDLVRTCVIDVVGKDVCIDPRGCDLYSIEAKGAKPNSYTSYFRPYFDEDCRRQDDDIFGSLTGSNYYSVHERKGIDIGDKVERFASEFDESTAYTLAVTLKTKSVYRFPVSVTDQLSLYTLNGKAAQKIVRLSDTEIRIFFDIPLYVKEDEIVGSITCSFIPPNDGQALPESSKPETWSCVAYTGGNLTLTSVETKMFGKILNGTAMLGDKVDIWATFELKKGYKFAESMNVKVNGEEGQVIRISDTAAAVARKNPIEITVNSGIKITEDLPETIEYTPGEDLPLAIKASGNNLSYYWRIYSVNQSGSGVKQKFERVSEDLEIYSSFGIVKGLTAEDEGKDIRVTVYNDSGNNYSSYGKLKIADPGSKKTVLTELRATVAVPAAGDVPAMPVSAEPEKYTVTDFRWYDLTGKKDNPAVFEGGSLYQLDLTFVPGEGYEVSELITKYYVNDRATGYYSAYNKNMQRTTFYIEGEKPEEPLKPEESPKKEEPPKELTTPFIDVPKDAYYYDATVWAYNAKPQITDGNGKDKFMPEQICTRGQVVTFLWRSAGQPAPAKTVNPFEDVKKDDYFYEPVLWAFYNDTQITDGTDPAHFSPGNPCKNSHILTFIWRALGEPGKTENAETWYTDAYNWARYDANLLEGTFIGSYDINAQCPRKNVVQYLYQYYVMSGL